MSKREIPSRRGDWKIGALLFAVVLAVYFATGAVYVSAPIRAPGPVGVVPGVQDGFTGIDCFSVNDSSAVIAQSLSLLNDGDLSFRPEEIPHMLYWRIEGVDTDDTFTLPAIDERLQSWIEAGTVKPAKPFPQIVRTTEPKTFLNCFGIGGALTSAPAFAVAQLWYGPLDKQPDVLDRVAFAEGAALAAASCLFLFLTLRRFLTVSQAVVLVLAYGLGTCVYSTSSQGLWQHSASAFFATLGLLFMSRLNERWWTPAALGVCMAMATLSRPTLGIVAAVVGAALLVADRKSFALYALAGLPFAVGLLIFNDVHLGSPFKFGQTVLVDHAEEKTGVPRIWQTPPWIGLAGLLISPSRGLFVYSPFFLASILGGALAWRRDGPWTWVRPLTVALPVVLFVESNHFDWWGGWSYGYRHLVDLTPFLIILIGPAAGVVFGRGLAPILFHLAVVWSVGVQVLGVTANDFWGWNARVGYKLVDETGAVAARTVDPAQARLWASAPGRRAEYEVLNIDRIENRGRLWSASDSQIAFCLQNFASGWASRQSQMWNARQPYQRKVAEAYRNLALAYQKAGAPDTALACLEWALEWDPSCQEAVVSLWDLLARAHGQPDRILNALESRRVQAPGDLAAAMYLGFLWLELGDATEAIRVLEDVLRRSPKEFARRFDLCAQNLRRRIQAESTFRPARDVSDRLDAVAEATSLYHAARLAELRGDLPEAERIYREAMVRRPEAPTSRSHLARVLLEQGRTAESKAMLEGDAPPR